MLPWFFWYWKGTHWQEAYIALFTAEWKGFARIYHFTRQLDVRRWGNSMEEWHWQYPLVIKHGKLGKSPRNGVFIGKTMNNRTTSIKPHQMTITLVSSKKTKLEHLPKNGGFAYLATFDSRRARRQDWLRQIRLFDPGRVHCLLLSKPMLGCTPSDIPSGKHTKNYGKWPMYRCFTYQNGDFPVRKL